MRRPGPLPAPPPRRDPGFTDFEEVDAGAAEPDTLTTDPWAMDADGEADAPASGTDSGDDADGPHDPATAPVEFYDTIGPMARRPSATVADTPLSSRPAGTDPDRDGGTVPGRGADGEPGQIGVREVWAAARARRRALRAEVRRFTARQRRRRRIWLTAGIAVAALVLGTLGAAYSPLFAVERVRVVGASTLDGAAVEEALAGQVGTPLPLVDSSEVKAALVAFPLVESYTLEARPPHELVVRVVERTPIGAIESPAGYTLVDAAGVALSTTPEPPEGHPLLDVRGGVDSRAFAAVGTVFRSLPDDIRAQITELSATTASDVSFVLGETDTTVVWGTADQSAQKAIVLETAMAQLPPDGVDTYDVSSPGALVVS
ncbi:FtsQ-type POTRA domain-containing protein [Microbacterium invictum]|uniref:Cell division protein FtsQ n=1 Tax=Microbacterium invictum TaxID=515415 RepID=A0AA40SNB1_9MICO|nr:MULTISPECIES: FtsQ-type POTRA domain-containing protein [Microbacterium]MBB4139376.1 cell division protein FtsQ [Microbacterium invictum]